MKLLLSWHMSCVHQPYNHAPLHSATVPKATYVGCTWAREGVSKLTQKKKILPLLLQGLEPRPFDPRVRLCTTELSTLPDFAVKGQSQAAFLKSHCDTGSAPSYLYELLHLYSPSRSLRSSSDTRMLKIQRFNRKTHGFRTFSHFGPHICNNLPQDIRHSATLSSFKSQLKTFLFSEYFS